VCPASGHLAAFLAYDFFFNLLQRPGQGRNVMLTLRGIVRFDPGQSCTKLFLELIRNSFVIQSLL
jgi:hypothetical protein